jgi:hypothetical protein
MEDADTAALLGYTKNMIPENRQAREKRGGNLEPDGRGGVGSYAENCTDTGAIDTTRRETDGKVG